MNESIRSSTSTILISLMFFTFSACNSSTPTPEPNTAGSTTVVFPNGPVQFSIPEHYSQRFEPGDTIAITPGGENGITLRFNLHRLPEPVAEEFVESQANEKGLTLTLMGDKIIFSETGTRSEGGRDYEMTYWQIGFGDSLVIMSTEVDGAQKATQSVRDCLAAVPKIIESLQKR